MRLVDIEPLVELVKGEHERVQNRFNEANVFKETNDVALWGAVLQEVGAFIGLMINAPTVDAVPVIRCKDCKYWQFEHYVGGQGMSCQMMNSDDVCLTEPTHFCGWAERKDNEIN